ncbi:MAG: PD-(D/E)XK nuclease family protein [Patescibacteria group bacterium]
MKPNVRRARNRFDPTATAPFPLSRSKIDFFLECPRCFYLDRREGIERPPSMPFTLNNAVDTLLKKEFDVHRARNTAHPLMRTYGIDAVPFQHPSIEQWRTALRRGISYHHIPTNFLVFGAIDDVWVDPKGELMIVDYKATAKQEKVTVAAHLYEGYKHQAEVYQWLFRRNGFPVSNTAYFVYCNGETDRAAFDGKLEFDIRIVPYVGSDAWVEGTLQDIRRCLETPAAPGPVAACAYCSYRDAATEALR